ncbi:UNVERIFIED_CONTAM: hypothetical protein HHA_454260 [Hammondia hammondi]|eukprot:XP_008887692.1 hypothetical protein HHA_454260 [Hammondia hammondi]
MTVLRSVAVNPVDSGLVWRLQSNDGNSKGFDCWPAPERQLLHHPNQDPRATRVGQALRREGNAAQKARQGNSLDFSPRGAGRPVVTGETVLDKGHAA